MKQSAIVFLTPDLIYTAQILGQIWCDFLWDPFHHDTQELWHFATIEKVRQRMLIPLVAANFRHY
jgi:hypothetical protein